MAKKTQAPHVRLKRYLDGLRDAGRSRREITNLLEIDSSHLTRILAGDRLPGRKLANTIERLTGAWDGEAPIRSTDWDALEAKAAR